MRHFRSNPFEIVISFWNNRQLIFKMSKQEAIGRYRGSVMGLAWSFLNPLLMLVIYTFVFSVVFEARWGLGGEESKADFALILFVGLIAHGLFAECVIRAPTLILSNANYVKKVVFPLEILPWVMLGSALFHSIVSLFVLLLAQVVLKQQIPVTAILFPFVLAPLALGTMGLAWFLSALGVYLRDVNQVAGIFSTVMLFISAVFYPITALPERLQVLQYFNPLAVIIEQSRAVLIFGELPSPGAWSILMGTGLVMAWAGFAWFQKTRKGFADVL